LRHITVDSGFNLLWLKLRPDTPQCYEYVAVEDVSGMVENFFQLNKWTQFFDPKGRTDLPPARVRHIAMRRCQINCDTLYEAPELLQDCELSDFAFSELEVEAAHLGHRPWSSCNPGHP
jgi:hypothetical protein